VSCHAFFHWLSVYFEVSSGFLMLPGSYASNSIIYFMFLPKDDTASVIFSGGYLAVISLLPLLAIAFPYTNVLRSFGSLHSYIIKILYANWRFFQIFLF